MTGANASSEAFVQLAPGKRVLHVATHGFFLEGSRQSAGQLGLDSHKQDESFLPSTAENSLLQSGVAVAGAIPRGAAGDDDTRGIKTAVEMGGVHLGGLGGGGRAGFLS